MIKNIITIFLISLIATGSIYGYSQYLKLQTCPTGYISIPDQDNKLCIAKYEMKKSPEGKAVSEAKGLPWVNLTRLEAVDACKSNGDLYQLIDNATWTSVARFIAAVPANWSTNKPHLGTINLGNAFSAPGAMLAASEIDDESCFAMGVECSHAAWNIHNRVHVLSNDEMIWDFSGNVAELTQDRLKGNVVVEPDFFKWIEFKRPPVAMFAPDQNCKDDPSEKEKNYCGFGKFVSTKNLVGAAITRGGYWGSKTGEDAGIFSTMLTMKDNEKSPKVGFRCIFKPLIKISSFEELLDYIQSR